MAILAESSANLYSSGIHRNPPESPESGRNQWGITKTSRFVGLVGLGLLFFGTVGRKAGGYNVHASLVVVSGIVSTSFLPVGKELPRGMLNIHELVKSRSIHLVSSKRWTSRRLETDWFETMPTCLPAVTQKNSPGISGFMRSVGWGAWPVREDTLGS